ncbi:hypothetical protein [Rhizobium laguerreae]|uniref:hypothetical protein n=1 Tax=Rhizobium laguerreae TaxID=1076926 RepID=UPI001C9210CA|nr:hypothetical protein [Rhizobium laguerreae]MBY3347298.1 hypothetical protein [Rhizobium laguerreae]MBY3354434.1 hypothetical protein [Rhizobium laguerreae]MBY3375305.1 hypothetical protein [Rhizobium laguerreae]MBY3430535.1 hypothetical protein [Rhizobium laguerreae]MBY3439183.1 hypothetical protein [Rhizobium laguerreae]
MVVTVCLPPTAADKLATLKGDPSCRALVENLKNWLASVAASGAAFASAPPSFLTVSNGGADPSPALHEFRASIRILTGRLNDLIGCEDVQEPDRDVMIDALAAHRLTLEREEEAVILQAAADGIVIDRRPDADPRAVLGLVEVEQAEA